MQRDRYRELYEKSPLGYQSLDSDGNFLIVNDAWLETLGYEKKDVIGKCFADFLTPEFKDAFRQRFPKFKSIGKIYSEFKMICKDGSIKDIAFDGRIGYNPDGSFKQTHCILKDITEYKKVEKELRESEEKYRTLFNTSAEGILITEIKTHKIKYANPAICQMLGYTEKELTTIDIDKIHPKKDLQVVLTKFKDNIGIRDPETLILVRKDGTNFYAEITGALITVDGQKCSAGFFHDVTEKKQQMEKLEESKKTAERYLNIAAEIILSLDTSGNITLLNESGHKLLGYNNNDLIGKNWFKTCLPHEVESEVSGVFKKLINGDIENVLIHENVVKTRSGELKTILWHNTLLTDSVGNITELMSSGEDITERKQMENVLQNSEAKYRKLFNSAPVGLVVIDSNGVIISINEAMISMGGIPIEKVLGKNFAEIGLLAPESIPSYLELFNKILQGKITEPFNTTWHSKLGKEVIAEIEASLLKQDGKVQGFQLIVRDITERKTAEKALYESEKSLRNIFSSISDPLFVFDQETGDILDANDKACSLYGYSRDEMLTLNASDMSAEPQATRDSMINFTNFVPIRYHKKKNGTVFTVEITASLFELNGRNVISASMRDITERKKAEEALIDEKLFSDELLNSQIDTVFLFDPATGSPIRWNRNFEQVISYSDKEIACIKAPDDFYDKEDLEKAKEYISRILSGGKGVVELSLITKHGKHIQFEYVVSVIKTTAGKTLFLSVGRDITDRKHAEAQILHLSFHDHLTDLYNRRFFEEEIKRLDTNRQLPLSFIMADLNGLKIVNDAFGHNEGDKLLKEAAKILKKVCRSDDILARWGGDEFIIILPKTTSDSAEEITQRIKKECAKTSGQKIPLSLAIGVTAKTEEVQDLQLIIIDAESNMYKNKLIEKESLGSSILSALEQVLYEKSNETKEHTDRIRDLTIKLGRKAKLASNQLDELSLLATLHDIGKVAIPETILLKEGNLTEKEWEIIKRHPEIGFNIAQSSPQIAHIAHAILSCHENWDGSGYPQGLKGNLIPVTSRIILICDAYDVMTNERAYKKAISKEVAIEELKRCAGTQFDPALVKMFIKIISK